MSLMIEIPKSRTSYVYSPYCIMQNQMTTEHSSGKFLQNQGFSIK